MKSYLKKRQFSPIRRSKSQFQQAKLKQFEVVSQNLALNLKKQTVKCTFSATWREVSDCNALKADNPCWTEAA